MTELANPFEVAADLIKEKGLPENRASAQTVVVGSVAGALVGGGLEVLYALPSVDMATAGVGGLLAGYVLATVGTRAYVRLRRNSTRRRAIWFAKQENIDQRVKAYRHRNCHDLAERVIVLAEEFRARRITYVVVLKKLEEIEQDYLQRAPQAVAGGQIELGENGPTAL
jgi:hypothetical protein